MSLRTFIVLIATALLACQAAALNLEELQSLYYSVDYNDPNFDREAADFLNQTDSPGDWDEAIDMWKNNSPDICREWLDAQLALDPASPKFRYLAIHLEEEPGTKLELSRALIESDPAFAGGFRALLLTYLNDFDSGDLFSGETEAGQTLSADLPLLLAYSRDFPADEYSRLAGIYAHLRGGEIDAAKDLLRQAVTAEDAWLNDLVLYDHVPLANCHQLLRLHIDLLRASTDEYHLYLADEYASMLLDYYLAEAHDYQALIAYFGADPASWKSSYIIYGLCLAYYYENDLPALTNLLTSEGNASEAVAFQDLWQEFNPEEAAEVYSAALAPSEEPLALYLHARTFDNPQDKLAQARELAAAYPKLDYGYALATETYVNELGSRAQNSAAVDSLAAGMAADAQILLNFYFRFPDEPRAQQARFLASLLSRDDPAALKAYQSLPPEDELPGLRTKLSAAAIALQRYDLLWQLTAEDVAAQVAQEMISPEETDRYQAANFCEAIYDSGNYPEMLARVDAHPEWLEFTDVQFLVANAHYFQKDYPKTIAMLRFMVQKGTLGHSYLSQVEDDSLTAHPDWQPLLDWAQTMPDPAADTLATEQEEPSEDKSSAPEPEPGYYDEFGNYYENDYPPEPEPDTPFGASLTADGNTIYPTLTYFDMLANHKYTYSLVYSVQDFGIADQGYELNTGRWFGRLVHHNGTTVYGDILPYTGTPRLLTDLERMYLGPDAPINRGITLLGDDEDADHDFPPSCDCFIQIESDVWLGYLQDNEYYTKYLIYSESEPIRMGELQCGRSVVSGDLSNGRYRTGNLWTELSTDITDYWAQTLGYPPRFDRGVTRFEAIRDLEANAGLLDWVQNTDQYGSDYSFLGLNDISSWAVMFGEGVGPYLLTFDACNDIFWGSAYVLTDW